MQPESSNKVKYHSGIDNSAKINVFCFGILVIFNCLWRNIRIFKANFTEQEIHRL